MKYSENGFWIEKMDNNLYRIGLSKKGQDDLGDVAFFEFSSRSVLSVDETFFSVEASKATTDLTAPLHAKVVKLNERLEKNPELLNSQKYEDNWIAVISQVDECDYLALADISGI